MRARSLSLALVVAATVMSARADEPGYELATQPPPPLKASQRARLSLTVIPRAGHRLLADGPVLVRLSGDNVTPERLLLRREDAVDPRAEAPRFELPIRAGQPGPARLDARCTFYLCKAARCRPVEAGVAFALTVEEPARVK